MEKFRAENRKTKTARWRPKGDKQTPFSSVLIPSLDRDRDRDKDRVGIRIGITELKYVVL